MLRQALQGAAHASTTQNVISPVQPSETGSHPETTLGQNQLPHSIPSTLQDWVQNPALQSVAPTIPSPNAIPRSRKERNMDDRSEEDVLLTDAAIGGSMRDMLYRDEEERLRLERAPSLSNGFGAVSVPSSPVRTGLSGSVRARNSDVPLPARRGDALSSFPDPVDLGYCTEAEGKYLFEM